MKTMLTWLTMLCVGRWTGFVSLADTQCRQRVMGNFSVYIFTIIYPSNGVCLSRMNIFSKIRSHADGLGLIFAIFFLNFFSSVWQGLWMPLCKRTFIQPKHNKYRSSTHCTFHHETNSASALMRSSIHHWCCEIGNSCGSATDVSGKSMVRNARYLTTTSQGLYSLNGKTSYRQISRSLEAARLGVIMIVSLWNLTGISAAVLPRCLSNFRAMGQV